MFYLVLAIASSAFVSIFMRISEKHIKNEMGMFMSNYAVCILLSFLFMNRQVDYLADPLAPRMIGLGLVSGILYLVSFIFLKFNMKHNGIVLASTFMKLGVLIPTVMAVIVFHEIPKGTQILGICLALTAIVMIHFEKDSIREGSKKIWLLVLLLVSGLTDAMANVYEQIGSAGIKDGYLFVTFLVAFLLAMIFALRGRDKITKKELFFGMLIGIPNYFSARFLLLALGSVDAVLAYPMYSAATLITITLVGIVFFKEAVSKKKACALGLIVLALCLLNIG